MRTLFAAYIFSLSSNLDIMYTTIVHILLFGRMPVLSWTDFNKCINSISIDSHLGKVVAKAMSISSIRTKKNEKDISHKINMKMETKAIRFLDKVNNIFTHIGLHFPRDIEQPHIVF